MRLNYISPSKLKRIRLCEARAEAMSTDEDYDEDVGDAAKVGVLAHEAARLWYTRALDEAGNPINDATGAPVYQYQDQNECFRAAIDACTQKKHPGTGQVMSELPKEISGLSLARNYFEQIAAHYRREALNVVFVERRYKGTMDNAVPIHLIIDLCVDRGSGILEIIDYKTGFFTMTREEMYDEDQVLMNLLAVRMDKQFEKYHTIQFTYFWVARGYETGPVSLSRERLEDYKHYLGNEYNRLYQITEPEENLNRFCGTCGRKIKCQKYRRWLSEAMTLDKIMTPEEMTKINDEDLMAQHQRMKGQLKALDEYTGRIEDYLKGQLTARQTTEILGKRYKAAHRAASHDTMNIHAVIALAKQHNVEISQLVTPNKKQVETLLGEKPGAIQHLQSTMKRGMTKDSLDIREIGAKKATKKKADKTPEAAPQPAPVMQPVNVGAVNELPPI